MGRRIHLPVRGPLVDRQQRKISYLRVSLTDRCNYRCTYCMPAEGVDLLPKEDLLRFEELTRLVQVFATLGVDRVRLTGGEPTIRKRVVEAVASLSEVAGIRQVVMTTNGHRLPELAAPLAEAGLRGVNVSIDTLCPDRFRRMTRRGDLARVLQGIEAARAAGLEVKTNTVALVEENASELYELCKYAWNVGAVPRFIEHMPMSDGVLYSEGELLSARAIRAAIGQAAGAAVTVEPRGDGSTGPARYFRVRGQRFGIISAMTEHFCDTCNRVRLTATGELHTCLAYDDAVNLRELLRGGADDTAIEKAIRAAIAVKRDGHEFDTKGVGGPQKHMVSIGG